NSEVRMGRLRKSGRMVRSRLLPISAVAGRDAPGANEGAAYHPARTIALTWSWRVIIPLFLLVLAVSTDRFGVKFGDTNFRTELIAGGLLALWLLVFRILDFRSWRW